MNYRGLLFVLLFLPMKCYIRIKKFIFDSISIDGDEVLNVTPQTNMWEYGGLDKDGVENPWAAGGKMAPFDQEVRLGYYLPKII